MAVTTFVFDGATLTGAAAKQGGDVPALTNRVITSAVLTNTTGAPIAATVWLAPSGGQAAANMVISARAIASGESYPCTEMINEGVSPGGAVWAMGNGLSFRYTAKDIVAG